jgi:anti-sigma regulatory factor (Ser/Thr protein kinase)
MKRMELELQAVPASAGALRARVAESLASYSVDQDAAGDFALAVTEAFINAVEHGARNPQARVNARLRVDQRSGMLELQYPGEPFDTEAPPLPPPDALNGRGRYLMTVLTDAVEYHFRNGMTRVRLVKHWR